MAIQTALLAYATFAAPHLLYHAANPSAELNSSEDLLNVVLLATGPVLAAVLAWRVGRARPVAPATPRQQGKEDEVPNDEAQVLAALAVFGSGMVAWAMPVGASHDHFLRTPGTCHQVAAGSTARDHQFHVKVHEPVGKNGGPLDPANAGGPPVGLSTTAC